MAEESLLSENQKIIQAVVRDIKARGSIFAAIKESLRTDAFYGDLPCRHVSKIGVVR
jgi:hypothetical protein